MKLNIGCGTKRISGWTGIDILKSSDIVWDLTKFPWPIDDNSVAKILADNIIEHLPDTIKTFDEMHRICKIECNTEIIYPYYRSLGAYSDPTHVHYFNEHLIEYFMPTKSTKSRFNKYSYYTTKHWKLIKRELITYPLLKKIPYKYLSFFSRHLFDIVHAVRIIITPMKYN